MQVIIRNYITISKLDFDIYKPTTYKYMFNYLHRPNIYKDKSFLLQ
jgi:predicted metallo-beta-lactamase superfamily hydrolase